jgi:hypothetical protein
MLRTGNSHETMLITVKTRQFNPEATSVAMGLPCRHSIDAKRRLGYVQALAGRRAS